VEYREQMVERVREGCIQPSPPARSNAPSKSYALNFT